MPPRHTYWTILFGNQPTAFRSATQEELLPTFKQIQAKHPDAVMMWFARGRLWQSPKRKRATAFERPRFDRPRGRPVANRRSHRGWPAEAAKRRRRDLAATDAARRSAARAEAGVADVRKAIDREDQARLAQSRDATKPAWRARRSREAAKATATAIGQSPPWQSRETGRRDDRVVRRSPRGRNRDRPRRSPKPGVEPTDRRAIGLAGPNRGRRPDRDDRRSRVGPQPEWKQPRAAIVRSRLETIGRKAIGPKTRAQRSAAGDRRSRGRP